MSKNKPVATLQDVRAIEAVPLSDRLSEFGSTWDVIRMAARKDPHNTAIKWLPSVGADVVDISYSALLHQINKAANLFTRLAKEAGSDVVVTIMLPNLPQYHFAIWGGQTAGIINPVNPMLEVDHIVDIMKAAETTILVTLGLDAPVPLWQKVKVIAAQVPGLSHILTIGGVPENGQIVGVDGKIVSVSDFDTALAGEDGAQLAFDRDIQPDDIAAWFHTGGTTGTPKLAGHTHFAEIANAWSANSVQQRETTDIALCGLPLFHVNAVMVTGLGVFMSGSTVLLATPQGYRDPDLIPNFWKIIAKHKVTTFSAVPTIYGTLLNIPIGDLDISSLKHVVCGAAAMPVEVFRKFQDYTGLEIIEGYGQTEGVCVTSVNPVNGTRKIGSVGLRLPYMRAKTVILDDQGNSARDCDTDEIGTLVIGGPMVFSGYKNPSDNNKLWPEDGYLNTGDLARMDKDGYIWLTGRSKDLIIRGGHNIDPASIEECLHQHPGVEAAAAVGMPDSYAGELPVAYVALKPGADVSSDALLAFCQGHMAEKAAIPKQIFIIPALPVTAVGKIFKPSLRHDVTNKVIRQALATAGFQSDRISVETANDDRYGAVSRISLAGVSTDQTEDTINQALQGYSFKYDVIVGK